MAKTIWKYSLQVSNESVLHMPEGAEVLAVQMQKGTLCMWALVNPKAELTTRTFCLYGTGHLVRGKYNLSNYIDTFQPSFGLVFHLFENVKCSTSSQKK